jgi:glycosyltransferase involved in cell wall biosynthesis
MWLAPPPPLRNVKVIIQIPCYNEAAALPVSVAALPRDVPGCDDVEYLVIDDGSTDDTAEVARELGVHHVITHSGNRGLAAAFMTGLTAAIERGADVIVNTDADNQYCAADIAHLVAPILEGDADMVIGARPIAATADFSIVKKALQRVGSWVVRVISRTSVEDAPSGFRALSREAAMRLKVFSRYTYTLETIIQAGHSNMRVVSVPIRTNAAMRPSRLVRSIPSYVLKSFVTIVRIFATYRPLFFFWSIALLFGAVGLIAGGRFLYFWTVGQGQGHVQSVVLAAACMTLSFIALVIGFVADLVAVNRKLLETVDWRIQHLSERWQRVQTPAPPPAHTAAPQRHTSWSESANRQETTTTSTTRETRSRDIS